MKKILILVMLAFATFTGAQAQSSVEQAQKTLDQAQKSLDNAKKTIKQHATASAAKQISEVGDTLGSMTKNAVSSIGTAVKTTGTAVMAGADTLGQMAKTGYHTVDTSSNFKLIVNNVTNGISALATGLKVGAEHVYKVLVMQQVVNSITSIIVYLALILIVFGALKWISNVGKTFTTKDHPHFGQDWDDHPEVIIPGAAVSVIAGITLVVYFASTIGDTVSGIINPEYGALKEIFIFVKNATGH